MMAFEEFGAFFGRAAKPRMNMSIYRDVFECACGQSHWFDERQIDIICDGFSKVMVACPNDSTYITSLKIKTFMIFKFIGFESLAGTHLTSLQDHAAMRVLRVVVMRA